MLNRIGNNRRLSNYIQRLAAAGFALACILGLVSCGVLLPVPEGEYHQKKEGIPGYYSEGFEANDGTTSTLHYFVRTANGAGEKPAVSRDWASEGSWSMKIPAGCQLSFNIQPQEFGYLNFSLSGVGAGYFIIHGETTTNNYYTDIDSASGVVNVSAVLDLGKTYTISFPAWHETIFLDEITFEPILDEAVPENNAVVSESPSLTWHGIPGGAPYRLQVSEREDFSLLLRDVANLNDPNYSLSGLSVGRDYFWRIQTQKTAKLGIWSSPLRFTIAGPPHDDSFETSLDGAGALNVWHRKGATLPYLTVGDAVKGSHSVRMDHADTLDADTCLETTVITDNPKVLHYSYKIVGQPDTDTPAVDLRFSSTIGQGANKKSYTGLNQYTTGTGWVTASQYLGTGINVLKWTFSRIRAAGYPGSYALIDDLRFDDLQTFTGDDFESVDPSGKTRFDWGYGGPQPSFIQSNGGVGDSRCINLPIQRVRDGSLVDVPRLRLIADFSGGPFMLGIKSKGGFDVGIKADGGNTAEFSSRSMDFLRVPGWHEQFFYIDPSPIYGIDLYNEGGNEIELVDDVRSIPFIPLGSLGLTEDFESGSLDGDYIYDRTCPPTLDSTSPHSGSYCLRLDKTNRPYHKVLIFPVRSEVPYTISFWARSSGTKLDADLFSLDIQEAYGLSTEGFYGIDSTWRKFSRTILPGSSPSFPLRFMLSFSADSDYAIYLDDFEIKPL
jgi:hypothetical protein